MLKPFGDRVLVEPLEQVTPSSNIIIPDSVERPSTNQRHGKVVSISDKVLKQNIEGLFVGATVVYEDVGVKYDKYKLIHMEYIKAVIC